MQPFKLVASQLASLASPMNWSLLLHRVWAPSLGSYCEPSDNGQDLWAVTTAVFNSCCWRICPSTNGYTMLHLCSCAIAIMNSTARRYPSYILKEHQARCCHERDASKGQAVLELVSSLLPYSIVVVHMSHPWHFHRLPVQVCRRKGLPRNVALWHWVWHRQLGPIKAPRARKLRSFKVQKAQGDTKSAKAENPKECMAFGDARRHGRKRCQMMKVIRLVEARNLASEFPAPDAGTGTVWLRSKSGNKWCSDANQASMVNFTNQQEDRIQLHGGSATFSNISHMYGSPLDLGIF